MNIYLRLNEGIRLLTEIVTELGKEKQESLLGEFDFLFSRLKEAMR